MFSSSGINRQVIDGWTIESATGPMTIFTQSGAGITMHANFVPGEYVLKLQAHDSRSVRWDDVRISVVL